MLRIALLGSGRIGQVHARSIATARNAKLAAVAGGSSQSAARLAIEYDTVSRPLDEIFADDAVDAVLIASSTDTHCELIERAAQAGKAVLCEKPVDLSLQRALDCEACVSRTNVPVMIGFNRRFDPNHAALKAAFDNGRIGKAEMLSITSFDPAPPPLDYIKVSGGLFRDMMIHDFDIACWIMGELPQQIVAVGTSVVDLRIGAAGDVDTAVATLTFSDGRLAVIRNSRRAAYGHDQRIELLGEHGLLRSDNVIENTVTVSDRSGVLGAKPHHFFLERYMRSFELELAAFVDAVQSRQPMPIPMKAGIDALACAEAATLSSRCGRPVAVTRRQPAV